ncbi:MULTISPECIES: hypothetical protein [Bacillus]|uniref:hypothetical protein n=1 Tax=Bacillus TaxID=1386 RepID=UPI000779A640|nr:MULTISPECIES: hypothetical protein [Bacillus]MBL4956692.1 hypothetical protein [Bacillus velezensis]MBL4960508.1 hypothetical protein [Bacillus velezensis]MCX2811858.1 hypothetical protein [Bacillus sp. ChL18]
MTINHAGTLNKEYFLSYMNLIMNAHQNTVDQAKELAFQRLFGAQTNSLGRRSYENFLLAYKELKGSEK